MASGDDVDRPWTDEQIVSDAVGKKVIVTFLQEHASKNFLKEHKMLGSLKNVIKNGNKDQFVKAYNELFAKKAFKRPGEEDEEVEEVTKKTADVKIKQKVKEEKVVEPTKFTKKILKQGDKVTYPKKGEYVSVWYTGKLTDDTVFDTNILSGKKKKTATPLKFKVGTGQVIRGWDEGLQTMTLKEKAELTIEPEWAYGKKGKPDAKIPPGSTLIFEVELHILEDLMSKWGKVHRRQSKVLSKSTEQEVILNPNFPKSVKFNKGLLMKFDRITPF